MMKLASTRIGLLTAALGAAGALAILPLGHEAAANGISGAVSAAAKAESGASVRAGGLSVGAGGASDTAAGVASSRSNTDSDTVQRAIGTDIASSDAANADVSGPRGGSIDLGVAGDSDTAASVQIIRATK
jgi:hypothetical protein